MKNLLALLLFCAGFSSVLLGCTEDITTDYQLTTSGYHVESNVSCISVCNSYNPSVFLYAFFFENQLCFCSNASLPQLNIFTNNTCFENTCLNGNSSTDCIFSYQVFPLTLGIIERNITFSPKIAVVDNEVQIQTNVVKGDASSAYVIPIPNDLPPLVQTVKGMTVNTHFYLPGLHKWTQTIGNSYADPFNTTSWLQVNEGVGGVNIIPSTDMVNGVYNFFLTITKGTNLNVNIMLPMNENLNFTTDIMRLSFGYDLAFLYTSQATSCSLEPGFVLKQVVLTSGYLTKLKLNVFAKGTLEVAILRPKSSSFFKVSLVNQSQMLNTPKIVTALVVKQFLFLLNAIGVLEISFNSKNSEVQENDMIWIGGTASLICDRTDNEPMSGIQLGKTITFSTDAPNNSFFISFFISKPFEYLIPINTVGLFNLLANVSDYVPSFQIVNYSFPIQIPVSGLRFAENYPIRKNVAGYKPKSLLLLKAVIQSGSDVSYLFDIPKLNYSANISNGDTVNFTMTTLGFFTVYLTAANRLNSINTSIDIAVLSEINGLFLNVVKEQLQNSSYNTTVSLFNGTEVLLMIDFGDGTPPTVLTNIIGTGVSGYTYIINHTYSVCNVYTVTTYAANVLVYFNGIVNSTYSNSTNVTVFCLMSPLIVKTIPIPSLHLVAQKQYVKLSFGKPFILNIYQDIGSYRNYSIDWGDGTYSYNNQSVMNLNKYSPFSFQLIHLYEKANIYNLTVKSSNALQTLSFSNYIDVNECSVPDVSFYYGTILDPVTVVRSISNDFTAIVDSVRQNCKIEKFTFKWNLKSSISAFINSIEGILSQQKVIYTISKNSLDFGIYYLTLRYTYGVDYYDYTAYLNVTFLPLSMSIKNGLYAPYAYKLKDGNNTFFQNFTISATSSYDPDNQESGIQNITFTWSCKVASNFSDAIYAMENFTKWNLSISSDTCFNETWINISSNSAEMIFGTQQFLEGINYHIKVCGTKSAGKDIYFNELIKTNCFVQEILIVALEVPIIALKCISNCDEKLNFKERVIYSFICADCGFQRLAAKWIITNDSGVVPSEILSETATTTGFSTPSLVINKDILLESTNYTFMLVVGFAHSINRAKFKFTKTTCTTPTSGVCYVDPKEGVALKTKFGIFCNNWKDSDGVLNYMFFYDNGQSQRMNLTSTTTIDYPILNAASTDKPNLIDFVLGPGVKNNDFIIKIITQVSGKYKAYMESTHYIKVFPNERPKNMTNLMTNVNLLDVQSVTNLAQAISSNANKNSVDFYNETENNVKNQHQLLDLQEIRKQVIGLLNNVSIKDLDSFKSVSDALVVTSQVPLELGLSAQKQAADIIDKLAILFTKDNFKGIGADHYDIMTQSFVNSISNLFQAGLNNNKTEVVLSANQTTVTTTAATTPSNLSEGNSDFMSKLFKSLGNYFLIAQSYKVPGENATVGETNQFVFVLKKDFSSYLSNTTIGSIDGGFTLPDSHDMFNESVQKIQILQHNVRMKEIVYTWDTDRSRNILSESQSLTFSDVNGHPIKVSNSSQPIHIAIKNMPEKMYSNNISLSMPNNIYQVRLPLIPDCNMLLKFLIKNDPNNLTNLIVYIQYGKVATKSEHDIMLNISAKHSVVMTKNYNVKNITITENTNSANNGGLQRNQDAYLNNDSTLVLWNFSNATFAFLNNTELHLTFLYTGPMPDKKLDQNPYTFDEAESYGTFDYEMKSYCVECNYWNEDFNKWMSDGCQLDYYNTTFLVTKCECTHLTAFGGFFVSPNPLPKLSISKIKTGYTLLISVVIIIMLWIIGLLLARRIDKHDALKVGVCPLLDNLPEDKYLYEIVVNTGNRRNAGTKSNIFFTVTGDVTDSGVRHLKDPERECFQRSSCDVFIMTTPRTLGDLDFIRIWHDNSGGGWYIKNIVITDLQTEKKYLFIFQRWIAVDCSSSLDCVIPVASNEESTNFTYVFQTKAHNKFLDEHLWFSIFARPPKSNFTRCQRLSVAVSLIMTSMMISTLFYQRVPPAKPAIENQFGNFTFTYSTVFLLLVSSLAKLPVQLLIIKIFRLKLKHFKYVKDNSNSFLESSKIKEKKKAYRLYRLQDVSNVSLDEQQNTHSKKPHLFNWYLYIGWFICVGNIFVCSFIVFLYGTEFGNAKSLTWLSSVTIDFVKDIFVIEPMKIFVLAVIVALVVKKVNEDTIEVENEGKVLAHDEVWLHKMKHESENLKKKNLKSQPLDSMTLNKMRELGLKHMKMNALIIELTMYTLYATLVFFIGYKTREGIAFFQTRNVGELFNLQLRPGVSYNESTVFNQIQSSKDFWPWMEKFFLPNVYPDPWYNLSKLYANTDNKDFPGKLFLNDLTSKIVNGIRIRQIRVQSNSCIKPNLVAEYIKIDCLSQFFSASEETRDFHLNWSSKLNSTKDSLKTPWSYQTWQELDGYPYAADLDTYYGGGYVIEIFPKWKNKELLEQVKDSRWIDRQTRAVIIEFALFNAVTNYFNMVIMVLEFPASGGVVPNFSIITFNLYSSTKVLGITMMVSQILFILMMLVITVRECRFLYRAGRIYFLEFWNLVEAAIIILSYIAVGFFFYKEYLGKSLLKRLSTKKPQIFINFQFASYWDLTYINIVALIVFFVTLKFIKLLRFNRRISMLSSTLKAGWYPLSMFGIIVLIILCSFIFSCNIMFGAFIDGYQTYFKTIASIISLLLGKFSYSHFGKANPVLGPIFFLTFNIIVIWIVINMFVSILNDVFEAVRTSLETQSNDFEMVDFILEHFKDLLGFRPIKKEDMDKEADMAYQNKIVPTSLNSLITSSVTSVRKLKKKFSDRYKVKKERFRAVEINDNLKLTVIQQNFSKYDYLLNDNEVDSNESLNKFIACTSLLYKSSLANEKIHVSKNDERRMINVKTDFEDDECSIESIEIS